MDFMGLFTMGTGGHYITMLSADWSISASHDPLPSSCHGEMLLWNPSNLYSFAPFWYLISGIVFFIRFVMEWLHTHPTRSGAGECGTTNL